MVYQNNFQIDPPECVQNAIKSYREENDWLDDFLGECSMTAIKRNPVSCILLTAVTA